jgi:hypothetical protein
VNINTYYYSAGFNSVPMHNRHKQKAASSVQLMISGLFCFCFCAVCLAWGYLIYEIRVDPAAPKLLPFDDKRKTAEPVAQIIDLSHTQITTSRASFLSLIL